MIVRRGNNPFFGVLILLFLLIMIWLAISAVKGIFLILSWLALPLFVMALVLNHNVVIDYFKWLWKLLRKDTVKGLIYSGLSLLAYPFVSAYLAFKAYANNRWSHKKDDELPQGEYIKYQEVEIVEDEDDDFLDLPELDKVKQKQQGGNSTDNYDDMFE